MMTKKRKVLLGLLAVVAVQMFVIFAAYQGPVAEAQDAKTSEEDVGFKANKLLAVTGTCGQGDDVSVLYAIDTEKKQLAVYMSFGGTDVRFLAARKIYYDFELLHFQDRTPRTHSVVKLKEIYEKMQEGSSGTRSGRRKRR